MSTFASELNSRGLFRQAHARGPGLSPFTAGVLVCRMDYLVALLSGTSFQSQPPTAGVKTVLGAGRTAQHDAFSILT